MSAAVEALRQKLRPIAATLETAPLCWIDSDDDDHNDGLDYCYGCAERIVDSLRGWRLIARAQAGLEIGDEEDAIFVGSGSGCTEEDGGRFCEKCGVRLRHSLTDYGAESELDHFLQYGIGWTPCEAYDALEMLDALEHDDEHAAEIEELAARALAELDALEAAEALS